MVLLSDQPSAHPPDLGPIRAPVTGDARLGDGQGGTLAMDYGDVNDALARAAVTPAMFRFVDLGSNLMVSGVWADWLLLAGNRRNLEMRCPIVSGEATGVCAPTLDLSGQWARIHVRLDRIPALALPTGAGRRDAGADDPLAPVTPDPASAIAVIATSCGTGLWKYKLPRLLGSWFDAKLDELIAVFSVVLSDAASDDHRTAVRA